MKIYLYNDLETKKTLNSNGLDYTTAYISCLLSNMGVTADIIYPDQVKSGLLKNDDALIIGAETIDETIKEIIINTGCTVIALGTNLGFTKDGYNTGDKYATAGYFKFEGSNTPLPVFGSFNSTTEGTILGTILGKDNKEYPALSLINERIYLFSFDLAGTLLYAGDGKPTYENIPPFPLGRVPDSIILEQDYDFDIAFADIYTGYIRNILLEKGFPYIFELPEKNNDAADVVLYFAGDDDAHSAKNDMLASDEMYKRGLPYHLNLMPHADGTFVITKEQFDELHRRGCETAIHYDFTTFPYTYEGHKTQADYYEKAFGEKSVSPVNHCLVQVGTAGERYRWQAAFGAKSDNNRFQFKPDPSDINAFNLRGFASGTAFPRFVIDNAEYNNDRIDFCEVYNSYYEPRIINDTEEEYEKIKFYLDAAIENYRTIQLFTHPHYISGIFGDKNWALKAIDYAVDYLNKTGKTVIYSAPEAVGEWWHQRAACKITEVSNNGFTIINPNKNDVFIVLPNDINTSLNKVTKVINGITKTLLQIPSGETKITF